MQSLLGNREWMKRKKSCFSSSSFCRISRILRAFQRYDDESTKSVSAHPKPYSKWVRTWESEWHSQAIKWFHCFFYTFFFSLCYLKHNVLVISMEICLTRYGHWCWTTLCFGHKINTMCLVTLKYHASSWYVVHYCLEILREAQWEKMKKNKQQTVHSFCTTTNWLIGWARWETILKCCFSFIPKQMIWIHYQSASIQNIFSVL